jgi:hypothetical protein
VPQNFGDAVVYLLRRFCLNEKSFIFTLFYEKPAGFSGVVTEQEFCSLLPFLSVCQGGMLMTKDHYDAVSSTAL